MIFGAIGMKRPEDFTKIFKIYRAETQTSSRGRIKKNEPAYVRQLHCILSEIKPDEKLTFNQMGVTVTHTIFHTGAEEAKENDMLVLCDEATGEAKRYFRVKALKDHGGMAIFTTYYCEERGDINGLIDRPAVDTSESSGVDRSGTSQQGSTGDERTD